ncbi:MAG: TetR family transcriptional regulator [Acidobacteriota bacterium]
MTRFLRARTPGQKEARRQAILAAAATLFEKKGFDGVSLNAIARRACVAKSNIYRYFESREEIFLQLLLTELEDFVGALERTLEPYAASDDIDTVAKILTAAAVRRPRLCELLSVLTSVLEKNLSEATIRALKTELHSLQTLRLGNSLHAALPSLDPHACQRLLLHLHVLIVGLWPLENKPPAVAKVLDDPQFASMRTDFARDLEAGLVTVMRGLAAAPVA